MRNKKGWRRCGWEEEQSRSDCAFEGARECFHWLSESLLFLSVSKKWRVTLKIFKILWSTLSPQKQLLKVFTLSMPFWLPGTVHNIILLWWKALLVSVPSGTYRMEHLVSVFGIGRLRCTVLAGASSNSHGLITHGSASLTKKKKTKTKRNKTNKTCTPSHS